jgi:coenzyme F420-reducing hydrogenase beta subunit
VSVFEIIPQEDCVGCGACANICDSVAVRLEPDEDGYYKYTIDRDRCVQCRRCAGVCPVLNPPRTRNTKKPACYELQVLDEELLYRSSSGGAFPLMAKKILGSGGVVAGVAFRADFTAAHILIDTEADLLRLQKSKYLQSDTGDIYRRVKEALEGGRTVLFSGCPCHAAALRNYLGKDFDRLFVVDLLCAYQPSARFFTQYLADTFGAGRVKEYEFRHKRHGAPPNCDTIRVWDGEAVRVWNTGEDPYQQAFHSRLMIPRHCEHCRFSLLPHAGDVTIGDFWGIETRDQAIDPAYKKGMSVVLVNNRKGEALVQELKTQTRVLKAVPLEWVGNNGRISHIPETIRHPKRDLFYQLVKRTTFQKAVVAARDTRFDVGIVGIPFNSNWGSNLTYLALYHVLTDLGYTCLMIGQPESSISRQFPVEVSFESNPYPPGSVARKYGNKMEMSELNDVCTTFVVGSDQIFNTSLYKAFDEFICLDWVTSNHKKIAYAASFGHDRIWHSERLRAKLSFFLQGFDAFSVREDSGVRLTAEEFGIKAENVLDPVFLCEREYFKKIAERAHQNGARTPYVFSYIVSPSADRTGYLKYISKGKGLPLKLYLQYPNTQEFKENKIPLPFIEGKFERRLYDLITSDFVFTDSFHATCMAILFNIPFVTLLNAAVGAARFTSILNKLNLRHRMVSSVEELKSRPDLLEPFDYTPVNKILAAEKEASLNWLKNALEQTSGTKRAYSVYDVLKQEIQQLKLENAKLRGTTFIPESILTHFWRRVIKRVKSCPVLSRLKTLPVWDRKESIRK